MFIKMSVNPPNTGDIVIVQMDDGTIEKECYAIAAYNPEVPGNVNPFTPVNCHSSYDGYGTPELDFPVIAWMHIPT